MILAIDVHYTDNTAMAAGVSFNRWDQTFFDQAFTSLISGVKEYEPGSFYKREMPCILRLLQEHQLYPDCIVIDGFVFLDGKTLPGLGKYLYDALNASVPVVGVAKTAFKNIADEYKIFRGRSSKPLYVTAVGMSLEHVKNNIYKMHGSHRIPDLFKKVDQLSRGIIADEYN